MTAPLLGQPGERRLRLGEVLVLAFEIGGELGEPPLGFAAGREHPLQLLLELAADMGQPLQLGRGRRLGDPQRRQRRLGRLARALLGEGALGRLGDGALRGAQLGGTCARPRPRLRSQRAWNSSASVRRICSPSRR